MHLDQKTYSRLNKLMMLTQSDCDAEALAALRKANQILSEHGWNWDSVFRRETQSGDVSPEDFERDDQEISDAFEIVFPDAHGKFRLFVESLHRQYTKNGWLSDKQMGALFRARDRTLRTHKKAA